jgi:hypothetical protein
VDLISLIKTKDQRHQIRDQAWECMPLNMHLIFKKAKGIYKYIDKNTWKRKAVWLKN